MTIKVIGAGCPTCGTLYQNTLDAVAQLGLEATVEKVEDLVEIVKLGVMTAPALWVDGKLLLAGRVAKADKIAALLQGTLH